MVPTFDEAISQKLNRIKLPSLKSTEFWNSPAYQGLLNMQHAVKTVAELEARRAQLMNLMTRVAHEHKVSITHVHQMVQAAARSGPSTSRGATRRWTRPRETGTTSRLRLQAEDLGGLRARLETRGRGETRGRRGLGETRDRLDLQDRTCRTAPGSS